MVNTYKFTLPTLAGIVLLCGQVAQASPPSVGVFDDAKIAKLRQSDGAKVNKAVAQVARNRRLVAVFSGRSTWFAPGTKIVDVTSDILLKFKALNGKTASVPAPKAALSFPQRKEAPKAIAKKPLASAENVLLLRAAYAAFNARNIDAALVLMTSDVAWPRAFKGGFVRGPQAVRAYWTKQWSEINPRVEPVAFYQKGDGQVLVEVHQVVRDLSGAILADGKVGHLFTIKQGLIQAMEIASLAPSGPGA